MIINFIQTSKNFDDVDDILSSSIKSSYNHLKSRNHVIERKEYCAKNSDYIRVRNSKNFSEYIKNVSTCNKILFKNNHLKNKTHKKYSLQQIINILEEVSISEDFLQIFKIIKKDLLNTLVNAFTHLYTSDNNIKEIILSLNKSQSSKEKIVNFLINAEKLINLIYKFNHSIYFYKSNFLDSVIYNSHHDAIEYENIEEELNTNLHILQYSFYLKKFEYYQVLIYVTNYYKNTHDAFINNLCIYGMQNLFLNDLRFSKSRLFHIFGLFDIFNNRKNRYNLDWKEFLFNILSVSYEKLKDPNYSFEIQNMIFENKDSNLDYRLYLAMNSSDIVTTLNHYNEIQKNKDSGALINNLIDLLIQAKRHML